MAQPFSYICLLGSLFTLYASEIFFENQQLTHIPAVVEEIPADTIILTLNKNNIRNTSAQDFQGLNSLKVLKLEFNLLTAFPYLIYVCETLEELNLRDNAITEVLENELDILQHLRYLNLDSNLLTSLPNSEGPSQTLQTLLLSGNLMMDIPNLSKLGHSLERLELQYNKLQGISAGHIRSLDSIKYFMLYGNELKVFPDVSDISDTLVHFDLSDNTISEVPESHFVFPAQSRQALVINLQNNQLSTLPSPGCTPNNVHINLQGNPVHCDDRLAWLLSTTGIRYAFYEYTYQDYYFSENTTDVQYYNTLQYVICTSPDSLSGQVLTDLSYTDLGITANYNEALSFESVSSTIKVNSYMLGMPLSMSPALSRIECQALCAETAGCRFYNYRDGLDGQDSQCHYSDLLHGTQVEDQPDGGHGWTAYSSN